MSKKQVIEHCHFFKQTCFLKNNGYAFPIGFHRIGKVFCFAVYHHCSAVGLVYAANHFHQGGLPGPVLAADCMYLAALQIKINAVQRQNSRKCFYNIMQLQYCLPHAVSSFLVHCKISN